MACLWSERRTHSHARTVYEAGEYLAQAARIRVPHTSAPLTDKHLSNDWTDEPRGYHVQPRLLILSEYCTLSDYFNIANRALDGSSLVP